MNDEIFSPRKKASIANVRAAQEQEASSNFKETKIISMTFNMPEPWHTQFKMEAVKRGISMKELFEECWTVYKRHR